MKCFWANKLFIVKVMIIWFTICLSACGNQDSTEASDAPYDSIFPQESQAQKPIVLDTSWKKNGFILNETSIMSGLEEVSGFSEVAYGEVTLPEIAFEYDTMVVEEVYFRSFCYSLVYKENGDVKQYVLVKRNLSTGDAEKIGLPMLEGYTTGRIVSVDVVAEDDIALLYVKESRATVLHVNKAGETLYSIEIGESYTEAGVVLDNISQGLWWSDEAGYTYIVSGAGQEIVVFDEKGLLYLQKDYSAEEGKVLNGYHYVDGSLVWTINYEADFKTELVWLDVESGHFKELASFNQPYLRLFSVQENGHIFLKYQSRIWDWDVYTGKCQMIYEILGNLVPDSYDDYVSHVAVLNEEELQLIIHTKAETEYVTLSTKQEESGGIEFVDFVGRAYIKDSAVVYSREYLDIPIDYTEVAWKDEATWTRTMAELAAGKGPDIICLYNTNEEVQILYDKGVLENLEDMIPEETMNQIFPGIVEAGTVNGDFIGVCPEAIPRVLITSNDMWKEAHWTNEDILKLIETHSDLEGIITDMGEVNPFINLQVLSLRHFDNSPYIDWQQGVSNFESKLFIQSLEQSKIYGEQLGCNRMDVPEKIREGKYIAAIESIYTPYNYEEIRETYGKDCHVIGWAGQEDYVGYWNSACLVLVNKKSEYKEEIAGFLNYLLDKENQKAVYHIGVREDVVRESIYCDEYTNKWIYGTPENGRADFSEPDGGHYLDEFVDFLKRLGPDVQGTDLSAIVEEEADAYFSGQKDVESTVNVIDNRVQLYLDEQN